MKRFTLFLLMIAGLLSGRASETWNQFLTVETDTAEYVAPKDTTVYIPPVDTTHYEPVDTGEVVRPDVPSKPVIYVPTIHEGDNVTEFPHNPAVDDMLSSVKPAKQEFTMTIEGEYLRIKGTLMARGYDKHYIHCQIIGDSVHLQRFDMDPESTDMILHNVDIRIPGFTEDYYKVTLAEQNDVPIYKQYMMMAKAVTRSESALKERPYPQWTDEGELKFGETMYMLNVGAGKFFCSGNAWGLQTSVGDKGHKVYFEKHLTNGTWDGKTVYFRNSVENKEGKIMDVFFEDIKGVCYVDRGSHPNYYWKVEKNADNNYYRLSMAEANPDYQAWQADMNPGTYFGWNAANGTVASAFLNPATAGVHVDWTFLTIEQYEAHQSAIETYRVAQELKALIDEAREKGIGTKEQEDIYANEAATKDELEGAIATVMVAISNWHGQNTDPANPTNLTSKIVNPNYDNNNNTGWNGTTPGFQKYTNAEHYNKTFDTWQMVENLPNGVYKLTVQGFYRPTDQDAIGAVFYAANGTDSVTIPVTNVYDEVGENERVNNTMEYAGEQFAKGKYLNNVYFTVTNNKVRIGVTLPQLTGGSDWVIWDNWQLTYYGNKGEESCNGVVKEMINANLTRFDTVTAKMTVGTVENYKACLNSLTATDIAGINEAKLTIKEAIATVETNINAWKEYSKSVEWGREVVRMDYVYWNDTKRKLDEYLREEAPIYLKKEELTTEELLAQNVQIEQWIRNILIVAPCPTYMNWSYVSFDRSSADKKEVNSYTRYSIGDLTSVGRVSYVKLLEYTACDDHSAGDDVKVYRIRFDGRSRIYILKEDAPDYRKQGIILKEEGLDYLLYDFEMEEGEEFCKYTENGKDTVSITISERTTVTCSNGQTFNAQRLSMGTAWWIETWGSTEEFLYPFRPNRMERDCGSSLNYAFYMEGHEDPLFYYNPFGDIAGVSTAFKTDDCAMEEYSWLAIEENTIEDIRAQIRISGSTISCTAPDAVKLEVYTMDAIKVGEARFVDGKATVKVCEAPAIYLYIVTYPDGRRESGKAVKNEK